MRIDDDDDDDDDDGFCANVRVAMPGEGRHRCC